MLSNTNGALVSPRFVDGTGFITVDGDKMAATVLANPAAFPRECRSRRTPEATR